MLLFRGELSPGTTTFQEVEIKESGELVFSAADIGDEPREFWGDDDYEWSVTVAAADKPRVLEALVREMNGRTPGPAQSDDELLLHLLRQVYAGRFDAVDGARAWLEAHGIPYSFWSWI